MRLTLEEVRSLLTREEGLFLELKSLWNRASGQKKVRERREVRDDIAVNLAAFANAEGGTMVLGVEDDGAPSGHGYPEEAPAEFEKVPGARLQPPLAIEMERHRLGDSEVLVFQVPPHPEAVMVSGNGFPLRVQDQVIRESQESINARKQAMRRVGYDGLFRPEARIEHLDLELAAEFFKKTPHASRTADENLERYQLAVRDGPRILVSNAAVLLFARDIGRWHPRAGVRFARVNGKERRHGKERNVSQLKRIEVPLARLIEESHAFCAQHIRKSERLHDLFFREYPEYPARTASGPRPVNPGSRCCLA